MLKVAAVIMLAGGAVMLYGIIYAFIHWKRFLDLEKAVEVRFISAVISGAGIALLGMFIAAVYAAVR